MHNAIEEVPHTSGKKGPQVLSFSSWGSSSQKAIIVAYAFEDSPATCSLNLHAFKIMLITFEACKKSTDI